MKDCNRTTETSLVDDNSDVMTMFDRVHVTCRDSAKLRFRAGSSWSRATKFHCGKERLLEARMGGVEVNCGAQTLSYEDDVRLQ
jgi:hypothetical protein